MAPVPGVRQQLQLVGPAHPACVHRHHDLLAGVGEELVHGPEGAGHERGADGDRTRSRWATRPPSRRSSRPKKSRPTETPTERGDVPTPDVTRSSSACPAGTAGHTSSGRSTAASPTATCSSTSTTTGSSCGIAGADTHLLGIDRQVERMANERVAARRVRGRGRRVRRAGGQPGDPVRHWRDTRRGRRERTAPRLTQIAAAAADLPHVGPASRSLRLLPGAGAAPRRGHGSRRAHARPSSSSRRNGPWRSKPRSTRRPNRACPCHNDLLAANFLATVIASSPRLGVRGHERPLLRPREPRDEQRARRRRGGGAARGLLRFA